MTGGLVGTPPPTEFPHLEHVMNETLAVKVGDVRYFILHSYYHYIGEVVEVTGRNSCVLKNVVRVHSCGRDFTEFFRDGFLEDTVYTHWPDNTPIVGWLIAPSWHHSIPKPSQSNETRRRPR